LIANSASGPRGHIKYREWFFHAGKSLGMLWRDRSGVPNHVVFAGR
jgi:hypothetical protein